MERIVAAVMCALFGISFATPAIAADKAGAKCANTGEVMISKGKSLICIKSGNKLVWKTKKDLNLIQDSSSEVSPATYFLKSVDCNLISNQSHYTSVGMPLQPSINGQPLKTLPKSGEINALLIPVDFPAFRATSNPKSDFKAMTEGTNDFFRAMSYGKLTFKFEVPNRYVQLNKNPNDYNSSKWQSDQKPYFLDGLKAASESYQLDKYDVVYVVANPKIAFTDLTPGPAYFGPFSINNQNVYLGSSAGSFVNPRDSWRWLVHETGHLFGLVDLYGTGPDYLDDADRHRFFGDWDIMSQNWKSSPIEMNGWFRFQLGWIPQSEMNCTSLENIKQNNGLTVSLSAIENRTKNAKIVVVRLSSEKYLVIESRRNLGFDTVREANQGALIYVVDSLKAPYEGPFQIIRPSRSKDKMFLDAPLRSGEEILYESLKITSLKSDKQRDLIRLAAL